MTMSIFAVGLVIKRTSIEAGRRQQAFVPLKLAQTIKLASWGEIRFFLLFGRKPFKPQPKCYRHTSMWTRLSVRASPLVILLMHIFKLERRQLTPTYACTRLGCVILDVFSTICCP